MTKVNKDSWVKQNIVFLWTVFIALSIILWGAFYSESLSALSESLMSWVSTNFGWLYILAVVLFIGFLIFIAVSKYGRIRLGKDDDKPEFSNFSWYSMLFCGSTGIGLVFWSIVEPLSHYAAPPAGIDPVSFESIDFSVRTCYLHWGITQWACFAVVGLGIAFFHFRKGTNSQISNLLSPFAGDKLTVGWLGKTIDGFSVVVSFAGIATSLGLGVSQICGGLEYLFGVEKTNETMLIIIIFVTMVFVVSAITGVYKGIRLLSNINTYLAVLLLVLAFCIGPKIAILNNLTNSIGLHLQYLFRDLFMTNAFGENDWVMNWRVFYYAWFIAWCPFVGMFVARISKGRTIREFITGVVVVPTVFTIIWLAVFSAIAINTVQGWSLENILSLISSPETAVFIVFNEYPMARFISLLIITLLAVFFITSADSATYSLSVMTSNGSLNPPLYKKVSWGIIVSGIAYILLSAGSLKPLQVISIAASLPFLVIMILMLPAMLREMKNDLYKKNSQKQ